MRRLRFIVPLVLVMVIAVVILASSLSPEKGTDADIEKSNDTFQPLQKLNKLELVHASLGAHAIGGSDSDRQSYDRPGQESEIRLTEDDLLSWNMVYVGRDNPLDRSFTVDLVETVGGYLVDVRIHTYLEDMIRDAAKDGVELEVCSAYRSVSTQKSLIDRKAQSMISSGLDIDIAHHKALEYLAVPGESEHHTGLAVDFITPDKSTLDDSFADTEAFAWLSENAFRYGFILRYPAGKEDITGFPYEPWHYRYVGKEHAISMLNSGMCLEEYLSTAVR